VLARLPPCKRRLQTSSPNVQIFFVPREPGRGDTRAQAGVCARRLKLSRWLLGPWSKQPSNGGTDMWPLLRVKVVFTHAS
jgi:hypothetical protein